MVRTLHGQRIDKSKYSCEKKPIAIGPKTAVRNPLENLQTACFTAYLKDLGPANGIVKHPEHGGSCGKEDDGLYAVSPNDCLDASDAGVNEAQSGEANHGPTKGKA